MKGRKRVEMKVKARMREMKKRVSERVKMEREGKMTSRLKGKKTCLTMVRSGARSMKKLIS